MNDGTSGKPVISELEADRAEAMARHRAAQQAEQAGGDPGAIGAVMTAGDDCPTICGHRIAGVRGNSFTAACLVALQLFEAKTKGLALNSMTRAVALFVVQSNPKGAWQALAPDDVTPFLKMVEKVVFEDDLTVADLNTINLEIARLTESSKRPAEESFTKPETTPAPTPAPSSAT